MICRIQTFKRESSYSCSFDELINNCAKSLETELNAKFYSFEILSHNTDSRCEEIKILFWFNK